MQEEPTVLPARLPNLLINGSSGIAVGIATKIPPHNMGEVVAGLKALIRNPGITVRQLMQYIPAPDFPTGALRCARCAAPRREARRGAPRTCCGGGLVRREAWVAPPVQQALQYSWEPGCNACCRGPAARRAVLCDAAASWRRWRTHCVFHACCAERRQIVWQGPHRG